MSQGNTALKPVRLRGETLEQKFIEYCSHALDGGFINDKQGQEQLDIVRHFETSKYGALVMGNWGSGKSFVYECLVRILHKDDPKKFKFIEAHDLTLSFKEHGEKIINNYKNGNLLINDVGFEKAGKHYGQVMEVVDWLIQLRELSFKHVGVRTFITTNLTRDELAKRYGGRFDSRLNLMCDEFGVGISKSYYTDRRKLRNLIGFPDVIHPLPEDEQRLRDGIKATYEKMQSEEFVPKLFIEGKKLDEAI